METGLPSSVAARLAESAGTLANTRILVGLDGFVDTIMHVVKTRASATEYTRYEKMAEWGEKVREAAGVSANFEFVTQMVKLGGNGPIMANALRAYGTAVTYVGNLGSPAVHPVFGDLARNARVVSVAEPGYTDALEFDDGKLMFGKHESLKQIDWDRLTSLVSEAELIRIFQESSLVAMVNWTMLPHMSAIWEQLLARVIPHLGSHRPWMFFDLADPAKRSREDIKQALELIARFESSCRVILGLNLGEARQVGEVLGLGPLEETLGAVAHQASLIRGALKVDTVVIHPTHFAAAADASGAVHVQGPYLEKPLITTGAGDHFNAGFCIGRLLGLDLAGSLQLGVATSGYYVRTATSPGIEQMQ
jgi:sugar/nucleoside kinase (ribokinase family)